MEGIDLLGGASPHCNTSALLRRWPKGFMMGIIDGKETFGDATDIIRRALAHVHIPAVRVHAWWNDNHGKHVPIRTLEARCRTYENLILNAPSGKRLYVSPHCEYTRATAENVKRWVSIIRDLAPHCMPVLSPLDRATTINGVIIERHGKENVLPGEVISYDGGVKGEGLFDIDAEAWMRKAARCEYRLSWGPACNGREGDEYIDRPKRRGFPNYKYIHGLARLHEPSGNPPIKTFPDRVTKIVKPRVWKTFGEDMLGDGPRDNKGCLIVNEKASKVSIIDYRGKEVATLGYFGTYPGGLHRYYSGWKGGSNLYSYEIGERALARSGSEWVWFKVGKAVYGPACAPFRCGYWK